MGNTKWSGYLSYVAQNAEIDSVIKSAWVPVKKFSVKGGTARDVDLGAGDGVSVALEMEEAKRFRNISLFLPPGRGFEWHQLWEIAEHGLPVSLSFFTSGSVGKTLTHQFNLMSDNARISEAPIKFSDWDSRDVLKVNFALTDIKIVHGSRQGSHFAEEEI
jgi:hypothetical protein